MREYSVQALMDEVSRGVSERYPRVLVEGEVAQLTVAASGHAYLVLREPGAKRGAATLNGVCWRNVWNELSHRPKVGDRVVVRGKLGVYAQRGQVQLTVYEVRAAGEGKMARLIAERIERLTADGLLDPSRKRALPPLPRTIGVVASPTSAALQDFLRVSGERFPSARILLAPAVTQGEEAPSSVVRAMELLRDHGGAEVVVVTRGGGSKEDLMAFQDEQLARYVAHFPLPVVAAVGHQIDTTLIDLVADVSVPTPTAAAVAVCPDGLALAQAVDEANARLGRAMQRRLEVKRAALSALQARLRHPGERLADVRRRRDALSERLSAAMARQLQAERERLVRTEEQLDRAMRSGLDRRRNQLAGATTALEALSPLSVLSRGFAVVRQGERVLRHPDEAVVGEVVDIRLQGGSLLARVEAGSGAAQDQGL